MEIKEQRIELSLSSNYLSHWTVYDALREIFQNAFDRAKENSDAEWFYNDSVQSLGHLSVTVGNNNTQLTKRSLLLGETTKQNSKSSIGKFGEGYKLAMLVFLRNGINPTIRTDNEVWEFKLEYSNTFQATMLVVYINEVKEKTDDLSFTFNGIKKKTFNSYSQFNLLLQEDLKTESTHKGDLLLDKRNRGKIFVGGLYVCDYTGDAMYGYNFKPGTFELGRDRRTIGGIDLTWETSKAILEATKKNIEIEADVARGIATDKIKKTEGEYVHNWIDGFSKLKSKVWSIFQEKHPKAIPITDQDDYENVVATHVHKPETAYVSHSLKNIITSTDEHKEMEKDLEKKEIVEEETVYDILLGYRSKFLMDDETRNTFDEILELSENWEIK